MCEAYTSDFTNAGNALGFPIIFPGSGPIHLTDLACEGFEQNLLECPIEFFGGGARRRQVQTCSHEQDASVECGGMNGSTAEAIAARCVVV